MQNKGLIKFFAIIFALVCVYQLSFTFVANSISNDAKAFAKNDFSKELRYLDSIGKEKVFLGNTYNEVRDNQLQKGLDLEGGINVILQISVKDILNGLANESKNPAFKKALADAKKNQSGNQDYIDAFFKEANAANLKLAGADIFGNRNLDDVIKFNMTNAQVEPIIKKKVIESVESAFKVLRERIDKFGVTQPNIQMLGNSGRILVELPGAKDVDRIKKLLQSTAQLEFWETYKVEEISGYIIAANEALKKTEVAVKTEVAEVASTGIDSLLTDKKTDTINQTNGPLLDKLLMGGQQGSPYVGVFLTKDTAVVKSYLNRADIKALLPAELSNVKFVWGKIDEKKPEAIELYALKGNREGKAPISGGVIVDARDTFDQVGKPAVSMQMDGKGAKQWEKITGDVSQQGNAIAIVLDNTVYSAPGVSRGAISGGQSEISGDFSINETKDLANILKAGKLPAAAEIVQSDVVGPSLGKEAIDSGLMSFIIGFSLVLLWMVIYYGKTGFYANLALLVNILFIFGALASFGAVLTLPGIAGIVLTIGMAVDANVIIYERIREELRAGKSNSAAIRDGFQHSYSAIIDANVTTLLVAAVLSYFGLGPIKGFAVVLIIGVICSLFTAVLVGRLIIDWWTGKDKELSFWTGMSKNAFANIKVDWLGKRKMAYIFSGAIILTGLGSMFTKGFELGVEFKGGYAYNVQFADDVTVDMATLKTNLKEAFVDAPDPVVKSVSTSNTFAITTSYLINENEKDTPSKVMTALFNGVNKTAGGNLDKDAFQTDQLGITHVISSSKVGPTIADDIRRTSFYAGIFALLVVFLYIMIRFTRWEYSAGAVAALFHDSLIVLSIFSLLHGVLPFPMEIDQAFIAAILTVIGYSINDTVVVFDRIREYLGLHKKMPYKTVVNNALNSTLSRTINTSMSTILVLLMIFIFGLVVDVVLLVVD